MSREIRIIGPPGCGKSTRLATQEIPDAVRAYGPDKVVVTSFTRAGAIEIANKRSLKTNEKIQINPMHIGTLHALCYRLLSQPSIAELNIDKWNEENAQFSMSHGGIQDMDEGIGNTDGDSRSKNKGDAMLRQLNIFRNKMIPHEEWPQQVQIFDGLWKSFKNMHGYYDYTDLIERSINELPYAPGRPQVIFVDEAQDFTKLQLALIRKWGMKAEFIVLVGDEDQTIYEFSGATPDAFLKPDIEQKFKRFLTQSFRIPEAVHQHAVALIEQVAMREPKEYHPRRRKDGSYVKGALHKMDGRHHYRNAEGIVTLAEQHTASGQTVMLLTTCAYMLNGIRAYLRENGIPFQNQYRKKRGDWNPLLSGGGKVITARDLLVNFLESGEDENYWTVQQMLAWARFIKVGPTGLVRKKGKAALKFLKDKIESHETKGMFTTRHVIGEIFQPEIIETILSRDVDWLLDNMLSTKKEVMGFPLQVYKKYGKPGIIEDPKITIGTIHSVKGGESDVVMLFPDISYKSKKAIREARRNTTLAALQNAMDPHYRAFYVGMTRAREELYLMSPTPDNKAANRYVEIQNINPNPTGVKKAA